LEPRALEGYLTGFIGKSLVRIYIPSKRRIEVSRIGNVRFVAADYIPHTFIEIDAPASTSILPAVQSSITQVALPSTPEGLPSTPVVSPSTTLSHTTLLPTSPLTFTMPGAFEDDDQVQSTIDSSLFHRSQAPSPQVPSQLPSTPPPVSSRT